VSVPPITAPGSPLAVVAPTAVGRRASRAGWVIVGVAVLAFLAVSVAIVVMQPPTGPLAAWDPGLSDGTSVSDGTPFDISVAAGNRAGQETDLVWMVIDWRPDDRASDEDAVGRFVGCEPRIVASATTPMAARSCIGRGSRPESDARSSSRPRSRAWSRVRRSGTACRRARGPIPRPSPAATAGRPT
jgi:hypothetical protein